MARKSTPTYVLALLFGINLLNFYDRQILAVLIEPIRHEWNLSDTQLGWMSTAFILLYALVGIPLGRLADTGSRTRVLAVGTLIWSVFTAMGAFAWSYASMFASRLGVGVGEASCSPASNSLIAEMYPAEKRARAMSLFMLGLPIGIMLSSIISGLIARSLGWRAAFLAAAVPGILMALLIGRIADARTGEHAPGKASMSREVRTQSRLAPFIELWRIPSLRWIVVSGALHNFNAYAVSTFMPAYLMRFHGMSITQASLIAGFALGGTGIIGLVAGGIVADRARRRGAHVRLQAAIVSAAVATPCLFAGLLLPGGMIVPFVILVAIAWMLLYVYYVTVYPAIHDIVRPGLRGTAMAVYFFWMYVLGGAFGTAILGTLSDRLARRAMASSGETTISEASRAIGLHDAFFIVPVICLLLTLVLFLASRAMKRHMQPIEPVPSASALAA